MDANQPVSHVTQLKVPVPLPVHYTNCYVLDSSEGAVIVDAGMDTPDARRVWNEFIAQGGVVPGAVRFIFVTHFHPDHLGLADWLSQRLRVPVMMMEKEAAIATGHRRPRKAADESEIRRFYLNHGVPEDIVNHWMSLDKMFAEAIVLPHEFLTVSDGETVTVGSTRLQFIEQGGHTPHQGLVYLPDQNALLTGDQVLGRITPNVSLWPASEPDPLGDYIRSLQRLELLPHPIGLPAHEAVIGDVNQRVQELIQHHDQRGDKLVEFLAEGPKDAYTLTGLLFRRPLDDYQRRFAVGETLAHLEFLRLSGRLASGSEQPVLYERV